MRLQPYLRDHKFHFDLFMQCPQILSDSEQEPRFLLWIADPTDDRESDNIKPNPTWGGSGHLGKDSAIFSNWVARLTPGHDAFLESHACIRSFTQIHFCLPDLLLTFAAALLRAGR